MHFQCPHCARDFTRRASLRNHIKTHSNIIQRILEEIAQNDNEQQQQPETAEYDDDQLDQLEDDEQLDQLDQLEDDEQLDLKDDNGQQQQLNLNNDEEQLMLEEDVENDDEEQLMLEEEDAENDDEEMFDIDEQQTMDDYQVSK